ncbi:DoxX family protein [Nocardia sp. NPDC005366]|uniref:DoxX family protein n=1 Tax=Nocardia sp. NPDC005366 TaxID=3156878 RepID=UPI0033B1F2E1
MADKTKDTSGLAEPSTGEQTSVSTGRGVGSPYDSPTGQLPRVGMTKSPDSGADVPRTDDELGLDPGPDVPTVSARSDTSGTGATAADAPGAGGTAGGTTAGGATAGGATAAGTTAAGTTSAGTTAAGAKSAYSYASIPPAANPPGEPSRSLRRRTVDNRRGTLDLGLFLLRLVVGGTFVYHGLQKLTGWFNGPGLDGTRDMMADGGWDHATVCALLVTVGELGGGALLALGLVTPLAAGAVLAVILDAWAWKQGMIPGFQYRGSVPSGIELESVLAGTAAVIILTGPGRWSFDRNRGWATRPSYGSFGVLVLAVVAAIGAYWYLHGGNPFTGIGPFD